MLAPIAASLTVDTDQFDREHGRRRGQGQGVRGRDHKVKITAVFDTSSLSRARQQFAQLDQQVSKDAMSRLRSSPQGSVLGALNALFSPHPVTGAPSASQAAQQGLLGKIISQPGGGDPGHNGRQRRAGRARQRQRRPEQRQQHHRPPTGLTRSASRRTTPSAPRTGSTSPACRQAAGRSSPRTRSRPTSTRAASRRRPAQAGKDAADAADDALTKEAKSKGSGWFSGFLDGITAMVSKAGSGGGNGNSKNGNSSGGDASALDSGLIGGIGPGIAGISTKVAAIGTAVATALAALPALAGIAGTGLGVALIGGAVAAVVAESPKLKAQFTIDRHRYQDGAHRRRGADHPRPVRRPEPGAGLVKQLQAPLAGIFKTVAPQIQGVFSGLIPILNGVIGVMQAAAPAFGPFIEALEKLAGNIFPGIETVVKATVPVISQFGTILGQLGSNLGGLFADAAPAIQASMQVLERPAVRGRRAAAHPDPARRHLRHRPRPDFHPVRRRGEVAGARAAPGRPGAGVPRAGGRRRPCVRLRCHGDRDPGGHPRADRPGHRARQRIHRDGERRGLRRSSATPWRTSPGPSAR